MQYTAILFATDGTGETLTMSREVNSDDPAVIYPYLIAEAGITKDNVDTILLVRNGDNSAPEVFRHWMAISGNFEGL